ncbi:M13 family metallopeptidase [Ferrimonas balearica]|uniref:M13 family metallopeptidase n=1 Tax=Ferrimonas balearica TaxID=44012 RepID=UPI001C94280E|nr:M13-type metalloendopeptidase [Ferrimonas balearica]MBY5979469.1 peptidase M13 [Ferrimonas balearica]
MKKLIVGGLCASALVLAACSQTDTAQTPTAEAVQKALGSGIELQNFDNSIRPQDDFYGYVNGTWLKTAEIPADRTTTGAFYDLREKAQADVKAIIEELAATEGLEPGSDEQKVADLYRSMMDTDTINKLGVTPLKGEFDAIAALADKDELSAYIAHSQIIGGGTPLAFYISVDAKDSSRYATHIWQYGLSLPDRDYYFNDAERFVKIREGYLAHIEKMFELAGLPNAKASAETVMAMETALAEHHWTRVQSRDSEKRYNKYNVADLPELADSFNWARYLDTLGVAGEKAIIINQPSYIEGFGKVFGEYDLDAWKTYMTWQTLTHFAGQLSTELDEENFDFFARQLNGQAEQKARWKRGVDKVNGDLGEVVGKVYVKRHFTPEAKARMSELVENLRRAYGESIDDLEWMSPETKVKAKQKLAAFTPKIGYPDRWKDYSTLEVKADDLVGNSMRAAKWSHASEVAKLGGPIQKWEWYMTPQTVNAYYNPTMNEIVFPAAILQPPFFNMEAEDAVNYGGIGAVIGHEMGHGFDDQGSRYDGDGNLKNWWTEADLKAFQERGSKLVKQYAAYQVFDDLNVNGKLTLGENIGDLSGATIAYRAYQMSLDGQEAPVIDGMSGDERFFIGFTQIWRAKYKEEALRNRVATDPHSPSQFRANGPLANMPEFYETYDVKPTDAMYIAPEDRVKIW